MKAFSTAVFLSKRHLVVDVIWSESVRQKRMVNLCKDF